jgi:hypothetical protein
MDCWVCRRTAVGVCRFCGRGLCEDHAKFRPYIITVYTSPQAGRVRSLVVEDALFCGVCKPRPEPVDIPELS